MKDSGRLVLEVGNDKVHAAVAIDISRRCTHAGAHNAVFAIGHARFLGYVPEPTVLVMKESIRRAVVSNEDVRPTVFIEVDHRDAEAGAGGVVGAELHG